MIIIEHFFSALTSIWSNKLRSGLSMLGIIIGVFSIIVMMALGEGTTSSITDQFNSLGANLITIRAGFSNSTNARAKATMSTTSVLNDDYLEFLRNISGVKSVSPLVTASRQFVYDTYNTNTTINGVLPTYQSLKNLTLQSGEFITDAHETMNVVVLGNTLAANAFWSGADCIGKEVRLGKGIYTVIGVLADNSQANTAVFAPLQVVMLKIASTHAYSNFQAEITTATEMATMMSLIQSESQAYFNVATVDDLPVTVSSLSEVLSNIQTVTKTMSLFLSGIAAISLLVGGIGVMNIMLVSVTERTREIGIRKALGAYRSDILWQFLIEAMMISLIAGAIGIALSYGVVAIINTFIKSVITSNSIIMSFGSVVFIGIVFGILPASKASRLKPIDALRFE